MTKIHLISVAYLNISEKLKNFNMKIEKMTVDILRDMKKDEEVSFVLPGPMQINSAKSLAYQSQYILNCVFKTRVDYQNNVLYLKKHLYEATGN